MNVREPSTHLSRDKSSIDWIEGVLKGWGQWRARTDNVLSTGSQSPIAGIIGENTGRLYGVNTQIDRLAEQRRRLQIITELIALNYSGENLKQQVNKELREWRFKRRSLSQPKETIVSIPKIPGYNGNKYYSRVDKVISTLNSIYKNILIKKYEQGWEIVDFMEGMKWKKQTAKNRISEARKELRKLLEIELKA